MTLNIERILIGDLEATLIIILIRIVVVSKDKTK